MEIWLVHIEYDRMNDRLSMGCFQNGYVKYFSSGTSGINCIGLKRNKKPSNFNPVIFLPDDFSSNINRSHFLFPTSVDFFCLFVSCVCRLSVTPPHTHTHTTAAIRDRQRSAKRPAFHRPALLLQPCRLSFARAPGSSCTAASAGLNNALCLLCHPHQLYTRPQVLCRVCAHRQACFISSARVTAVPSRLVLKTCSCRHEKKKDQGDFLGMKPWRRTACF